MAAVRALEAGDLPAVHELLSVRSRRLYGVSEASEEHLRDRAALPGYDGWVAVEGAALVGYASLDATHEIELAADGASADLLERVVRRARERRFESLVVTVASGDDTLREQAQSAGFAHERTTLRMWRPVEALDEPVWPEGVGVRTYEPSDGEAVHRLLDRAYAGWDTGYVARPHEDWLAFMTEHDDFEPALWFIAERDGRPVGCALYWREHQGRGWLKDLAVDERERGRGLGAALVRHGLRAYAARGAERVGLKVDDANPTGAPQLYAALGFETDRRDEIWARRL